VQRTDEWWVTCRLRLVLFGAWNAHWQLSLVGSLFGVLNDGTSVDEASGTVLLQKMGYGVTEEQLALIPHLAAVGRHIRHELRDLSDAERARAKPSIQRSEARVTALGWGGGGRNVAPQVRDGRNGTGRQAKRGRWGCS
jgi:hypothetical protein